MVRISEIIHRTSTSDRWDILNGDSELNKRIYFIYDNILKLSDNYSILPHDMDSYQLSKIVDYKHLLNLVKDIVLSKYNKSTNVYKMVEEMSLYFDWLA